jgi:hypothetical protein
MESRACREHGRLPLSKGEGWGEGLQTIGRLVPLTPTLSPLGRGSPALPQIESVLIMKACVDMNIF